MSCGCENRRKGRELERARRLAKALARMEGETVAITKNGDGTYSFGAAGAETGKLIVEYITPY